MNVQEFGKLAGVTVRALHHYDRLGLLRPLRTEAGYRVYRARDLERLEQIVAPIGPTGRRRQRNRWRRSAIPRCGSSWVA